jgi:hypothetical protein
VIQNEFASLGLCLKYDFEKVILISIFHWFCFLFLFPCFFSFSPHDSGFLTLFALRISNHMTEKQTNQDEESDSTKEN